MDARLFDVLHDAGNHHILAVAQQVNIHFSGVFQKVINEHRPFLRILDRLFHVADDGIFVVSDYHGPPAEHVRWPHQHREFDGARAGDRFFHAGGDGARRLRNFQFIQQFSKTLAVFGQINGFRRGPNDGHAGGFQRQCQIQRGLPAELDNHADLSAARCLVFVHRQHVFQSEWLEVEAVAGVVVSGNRFRIAVDHDGFVAIFLQRKSSVAAAIIELDSLPDAVGPAAQNNDLLLRGGRSFVFFFVSGIEIRRVTLEFGGAGIHVFVNWADAMLLAQMANLLARPTAVG